MNSTQVNTPYCQFELNLSQSNRPTRWHGSGTDVSEIKQQISNLLQGKVRYSSNSSGSGSGSNSPNQSSQTTQQGQSGSTVTREYIFSESYFEGKEPCGMIDSYEIPSSLNLFNQSQSTQKETRAA
jgi:hypothetical protein